MIKGGFILEDCNPDMIREHERRITDAENKASQAHDRLNLLETVIHEIHNISVSIAVLIEEMKSMSLSVLTHDKEIKLIQASMETKESVMILCSRVDANEAKTQTNMNAIMSQLRNNAEEFKTHQNEPARNALAREKAIAKWAIFGIGSIIMTIITGFVLTMVKIAK